MFVEDLSAFFNDAEHAVQAVINGVTVRGIFSNGFAIGEGGVGMASTAPSLLLPDANVPADPVGMAVTIDGVQYVVAQPEPDGTGITTLYLERTS